MQPVAFRVGPFTAYWYGLWIAFGILAASFVARRQARLYGEDPDHVWDMLPWVVGLGIVGARLYHVFSQPTGDFAGWTYYQQHPLDIVAFWRGGFRGSGIFGAVIGGLAAVAVYTRRHRLSFLRWLDIAAPGLLLAQAIGRVGNYVNRELYGPPTSLPWGIPIDAAHRYGPYRDLVRYPVETTRFHPTFFYEAAWNLAGFGLLMWASRRFKDRLHPGDVMLLYGIWYPLGRLWVEMFRPDAWMFGVGALTTAQVISLASVALCASILGVRHGRRKSRVPAPGNVG